MWGRVEREACRVAGGAFLESGYASLRRGARTGLVRAESERAEACRD